MRAASLLLASGLLAACGPDEAAGALASSEAAAAAPAKGECRRFTTCVPENPCHTGWVTGCRGNTAICTDIGGWLSNGTSCGDAAVCYMGECETCAAGASCTMSDMYGSPDSCRLGAIACGSGQPVCEDAGSAPDGTACGGGGPYVCKGGQCTWCQDGLQCTPPDRPCHQGTVAACATTGGTCQDTGAPLQNGWWCGDGRVCRDGDCVACVWSAPCDPGSACYTGGYTDCSSGTPTCIPQQPRPDGESCGDGLVCSAGACVAACDSGHACAPAWNACATGTMTCYSPASGYCMQTGTKPDGTSCGDQLVCSGGWCQSCIPGTPCQSTNPCYPQGTLSCATGQCDPSDTPYADGTTCGIAGETCQAGTCTGIPGARLVVRSTLGTVDLTGTRWTYCEMSELAPQSQLRIDSYLDGGTSTHEEYTYDTPDCSGVPIPGNGMFFTGTFVAAGDRVVGWGEGPPPFGLPYTVTATAVSVTATNPSTGESMEFRTLAYVSDEGWLGPRRIFEGKTNEGMAADGYPTALVTAFKTEVAGCVPEAPCDPGYPTCTRWAIDCSNGAPQCTAREALPDGTSCGPGMECSASSCLPSLPPVTGSRTTTWWPDAGPLPPEPVTAPLEALVPQPDGTFLSRSAAIQPDGSFEISGVPEGPYLLKLSSGYPILVETDARVLDLGQDVIGRPGVARAPPGTAVTLELSNLAPWGVRDIVEMASSNAAMVAFPFGQAPIASVPVGATDLTRSYEWSSQPLLDPAQGDVGILFQSSSGTVPGTTLTYRAASRWAPIPEPIVPGVPQTLAMTLAEPAATGQLGAAWPIAAYAAHAAEVSPTGTVGHRLAVVASPWAAPWGPLSIPFTGSAAVDLLSVSAPAGTADLTVDALTFGRVLPPPYVEYRDVRTTVRVAIPNPSGGTLTWSGAIVRVDPLDAAPADAGPVVTPPQAPRVGGADAFTAQVNVGTGPTLSWSPPAIGAPTSYVVVIFSPVPGSTTSAFIRAAAKTTGTSFRFPESTLTAGETCFATITARRDAAERPDAPLRASFDADWASLVTATFSP